MSAAPSCAACGRDDRELRDYGTKTLCGVCAIADAAGDVSEGASRGQPRLPLADIFEAARKAGVRR